MSDKKFRERPAGNDLQELVPNPRIVLDCGAGNGGFAKMAFSVWPGATVHSFEPCSRFNQTLQPLNDRHQIHRVALGAEDGHVKLNVTYGPESNSVLEFMENGPLQRIHQVVGHETVDQCALDDIITAGASEVDVLKMDVQGSELMVLQGAKKLLETAKPVIYTEVAFQQQYQNQPLLETVDSYLESLGYTRLYLYPSPMPDIWGDAIYVHKDRASKEAIRLNIGAGNVVIPGFTPIDRKFGTEAYPLAYPDNSVSEIRCVHMLEHLSFREVVEALKEWNRVLKPGGRLRISVPDVEKVIALASEDKFDPHWRFYLMGGQTDDNDFHKSAWDHSHLQAYLEEHGFVGVQTWKDPGSADLARSDISLNLEGFKAGAAAASNPSNVKIRACCGLPRIGWNDSWQSFVDAFKPHGIPIETHTGCFWWQNMQNALSRALSDGIDWLFTLDYDSMILPHHIDRMMELFASRPDIDALASLQMRRGAETPLFSTGKTVADINGEPIKVNTSHFGLTLIRVAKLAAMPKPWLIDEPDKNGEYHGEHVDADIVFWNKWKAAGNSLFIAPDVRIGHLELLVSEFDDDYQPKHLHVGQWWNQHAAKGHCSRTTKAA